MEAPGEFHLAALGYQIAGVRTIQEIRHANLMSLIEQAGSIQAFANAIDRSHSQVSQLKNRSKHSKSGQPRAIERELASHIEQQLGLDAGWMDQDHLRVNDWPFPDIDRERYDRLSESDRRYVQGAMHQAIQHCEERHGIEPLLTTGESRVSVPLTVHQSRKRYVA
jgi:hypothetical protein